MAWAFGGRAGVGWRDLLLAAKLMTGEGGCPGCTKGAVASGRRSRRRRHAARR